MKQMALWALIFVSVFLTGCATSPKEWFAPGNPVAEITVQAAALKYIDGEQEKAEGLLSFTQDAKRYLDGNPDARAAEAVVMLKAFVPWEELGEAETLLAIAAFTVIQNEIEVRIEQGGLSADSRIYLLNMLSWVERTCQAYIDAPAQSQLRQERHQDTLEVTAFMPIQEGVSA